MRIYLFALLPLMVVSLEVEKAPTARGMGPPDSDLLNPVRPKGKRKRADEETDDYNDVETQPIKNKDNSGLKSVTYAPIIQAYDIPKYADVSTLSPIAEQYLQSQKSRGGSGVAGGNGGRVNQPRNGWSPAQERRKGYYFMHYPWNMLPKAYRIRPSYQFYYPTQYQNTVYSYPSNPYSDPYGVYRQLIPCGSPGGYCGYQGYGGSGCGGGSCGGGCGGGGSAGGCGDSTGYSGDNDSEETEEGDEDETTGGKSGETKINKADPLDDLDLEDLEKLDKDKGDEKEGGVEEDVEKKKKKRKNH